MDMATTEGSLAEQGKQEDMARLAAAEQCMQEELARLEEIAREIDDANA